MELSKRSTLRAGFVYVSKIYLQIQTKYGEDREAHFVTLLVFETERQLNTSPHISDGYTE